MRVHHLLVRDQQMLIDAADQFEWIDWKKVVGYWLNAADVSRFARTSLLALGGQNAHMTSPSCLYTHNLDASGEWGTKLA